MVISRHHTTVLSCKGKQQVTVYFSSKQLLLFAFAMQSASNKGGVWPARLILIQRDAKQQSQVWQDIYLSTMYYIVATLYSECQV